VAKLFGIRLLRRSQVKAGASPFSKQNREPTPTRDSPSKN